ncbi:MAG: hypothetical protein JWN28_601 [Candidatus Saccharibacteria bacterium]|nr:hypothetical protein [Candidatus Saccharibacteria bacterium]
MIINDVPFISNTPDDTHCLQAAYMSIAKYFDPKFDFSMDDWAILTGYEEGLGTWANAGLVWFTENGYEVKHYETFDFKEFIKSPKEYMIQIHGIEAGNWGYEHTNVPKEIQRMKELLAADIVENKEPSIEDIKNGLNEGYLPRVTINAYVLDEEVGYEGHAVVITGYDDKFIVLHDPGLPALANRKIPVDVFMNAWSAQEKELDLIRLIRK